uniref:Uncharacterized protein n=1 Tax=Arundo donax TaxID=35708 RepID=A0A0A9GDG4_ARUDO
MRVPLTIRGRCDVSPVLNAIKRDISHQHAVNWSLLVMVLPEIEATML